MKTFLIILTLFLTTFSAYAEDLNSLKQEVNKLYKSRRPYFPHVIPTEERFQEVVTNPKNKDNLTEIYKSRLEFLSDVHKLRRNEYLAKSIKAFAKKRLGITPKSTKAEHKATFKGYNRYLYEVSNIDTKYNELLHVFSSLSGSDKIVSIELFTPYFTLSNSGYSYNPYDKDNFGKAKVVDYKKQGDLHIFKHEGKSYTLLFLDNNGEFWSTHPYGEKEKDDFVSNYENEELFDYMTTANENRRYKNPKTGVSLIVTKLYED